MKKKVTLIVVAVLLALSIVVGISYAYWRLTYTQTGVNKLLSSCFSMELANEKNNITLDSAYPISDEKGKVLTPYSFTITNTCDLFASYTINLEMLEGTTLNSKYIKTMINNEAITNLNTLETTDTSIEGATESRVLFKGSLGSGDSTDYTLRIWMDGDTPATDDTMNKIFQGKITVTAEVSTYSPVENGFTNLAEALLVNEYQTTSLEVAKNKISSKQEVDTTKTAPLIEWKEVISTTTEYRDSVNAASSAVGTYNIEEEMAQVLFGKSYTFNKETGYYQLNDTAFYYPNDVDFSSDDYYFCGCTVSPTDSNTLGSYNATSCTVLNKVANLNSETDGTFTLSGGDKVASKRYRFSVYKMKATELESDKSDKGLYETLDDYGTTYYYRGNVNNNYVKFANHYWQVVRINGDGSIRLLYAGDTDTNYGIGSSTFNDSKTNPTYVGYMYSSTLNTSYEDTISNDNDSAIKTTLDNWYKTNIVDKGLSSYIADSGFCNDRTLTSNSPGDGSDESAYAYFGPRIRVRNHVPSLICSNPTNDLFTLNGNVNGNEKLTYPIGLLTADELSFSGFAYGFINKLAYTYSSKSYWTMSPQYFASTWSKSVMWAVNSDGSFGEINVDRVLEVRPVINLKGDTEITGGIGTKNDPFIIK